MLLTPVQLLRSKLGTSVIELQLVKALFAVVTLDESWAALFEAMRS
jgi:hypothetical protein